MQCASVYAVAVLAPAHDAFTATSSAVRAAYVLDRDRDFHRLRCPGILL